MKSPDRDAADELATRLTELQAKATPGPWHGDPYDCYIWGNAQMGEMVADHPSHVEPNAQLRMRGVGAKLPIADNMRLIIALRNAVPQIIAQASELATLRRRVETGSERIIRYGQHLPNCPRGEAFAAGDVIPRECKCGFSDAISEAMFGSPPARKE